MKIWIQVVLLLWPAASRSIEYSYINSRKQTIQLNLAPQAAMTDMKLVFQAPLSQRRFWLGRQLMLRLAPDHQQQLSQLLGQFHLELLERLDERTLLIRASDAASVLRVSSRLAHWASVEWALPDFVVPVQLYAKPNDPLYSQQWYLEQAGQAHIHIEGAWQVSQGSPEVVVAVVDTGVDSTHPDFGRESIVLVHDATSGQNPEPGPHCADAHGTMCAGLIVAKRNNAEGIAGVCPQCSLMSVKMLDGDTTQLQLSDGYRALQFAVANGAWVLSNSWGIQEYFTDYIDMEPFYETIRKATTQGRQGRGAVVLFAAGNGDWSGRATQIGEHELPAMPEVMAIGASSNQDVVTAYSDFGPNLSLVAPSGALDPSEFGIVTTDTVGAKGVSRDGWFYLPSIFEDSITHLTEVDTLGNYTKHFNGTSASCPIVAGVAALVFSVDPDLSASQVRQILEQTADKVGQVVYDQRGHNPYYGFGRINAERALRATKLGFDELDGSPCVAPLNCQSGLCYIDPAYPDQGVCASICSLPTDCRAGLDCIQVADDQQRCLHSCGQHQDCLADQLCINGACMHLSCWEESDCPEQSACLARRDAGTCKRLCDSDEDCVANEMCLAAMGGNVCQEVACLDSSTCPQGTLCSLGYGGFCKKPCLLHSDCQSPSVCLTSGLPLLCQTVRCLAHVDCPPQTLCTSHGVCQPFESAPLPPRSGCQSVSAPLGFIPLYFIFLFWVTIYTGFPSRRAGYRE